MAIIFNVRREGLKTQTVAVSRPGSWAFDAPTFHRKADGPLE